MYIYMSNYVILNECYKNAEKLELNIKTSKNINKKIDVYKNDKFLFSIGNIKYSDYNYYIKDYNLDYANKRRILYYKRNKMSEKDKLDNNTRKYISSKILW